jgi:hypothetical protein
MCLNRNGLSITHARLVQEKTQLQMDLLPSAKILIFLCCTPKIKVFDAVDIHNFSVSPHREVMASCSSTSLLQTCEQVREVYLDPPVPVMPLLHPVNLPHYSILTTSSLKVDLRKGVIFL